jgi:predicted ester cyclase
VQDEPREPREPLEQVGERVELPHDLDVAEALELEHEIDGPLTDGPAAAAEGTLAGTHDGVLHTPDGDVAPTGRAVELRWAAVYLTDGDTLKSEHLFFDQMDFLGQLGLLPD